jgi:hypothetical protein
MAENPIHLVSAESFDHEVGWFLEVTLDFQEGSKQLFQKVISESYFCLS